MLTREEVEREYQEAMYQPFHERAPWFHMIETALSLYARAEQAGERMRELEGLLRDWCSVPWDHKTDEMLSRTLAALKEAPDA